MTKAQLIQALEPFDDAIQIEISRGDEFRYPTRIFYYARNGEIRLAISEIKPNSKYIELRIED